MPKEPNRLFDAFEVLVPQDNSSSPSKLHAYVIESTAPDNIDDEKSKIHNNINEYNEKYKDRLKYLEGPDEGKDVVKTIARALKKSSNPTLVIGVHGFNSASPGIIGDYLNEFENINDDKHIENHDVVGVGYRWPSEGIGAPKYSIISAAPFFLIFLFCFGLIIGEFPWYEHMHGGIGDLWTWILTLVGAVLLFTPVTLIILRIVVYFRDGYRATSYGIADLVEIIRQIDKELTPDRKPLKKRVALSLVGHSMGAYVVTSAVRILSDVFDPDTMRKGLNETEIPASGKEKLSELGHAFTLERLVLVSPDIPAEALITNRANFLRNSLMRFNEAFLFSNEGDEVLRQISTTANYFSFPTRHRKYGFRLGNIRVRAPDYEYGIVGKVDLKSLQVGDMTLHEWQNKFEEMGCGQHPVEDLPDRFSYFDCTDCVEKGEGKLTSAKPGRKNKFTWRRHCLLLLRYMGRKWFGGPDVHAGYFQSRFLGKLINRLAYIGYASTVKAFDDEGFALDKLYEWHQIRVLVSPNIRKTRVVSGDSWPQLWEKIIPGHATPR
jgi:pimeloyl-ACP methyl ester carboxylesterase